MSFRGPTFMVSEWLYEACPGDSSSVHDMIMQYYYACLPTRKRSDTGYG